MASIINNLRLFFKKIAHKDWWYFRRYWLSYNSRFLHFCSFAKPFFLGLIITLAPIAITFVFAFFLFHFKIDENSSFFNVADEVWATCSALFGFFLSVFIIALTKEKTFFGVSFHELYSKVFWRPRSVEYYLLYWEIYYFCFSFVALIKRHFFNIFWGSIALGCLSLISFLLIYFRLRASDKKTWLRNMKELHYLSKVPFYLEQTFSFVNFYQGTFPIRTRSLQRFGNAAETMKICLDYLSKQLARHESIYPDFDIFLSALAFVPRCINSDFDFVSLDSAFIEPSFAFVEELRKDGQTAAATELEETLCEFILSLKDAPVFQKTKKAASLLELLLTNQNCKEEIEMDVYAADASFMETAFLKYLKLAKDSLYLGKDLPNRSLLQRIDNQISSSQINDSLFVFSLAEAKSGNKVMAKIVQSFDRLRR
jgi:hypothetical protein